MKYKIYKQEKYMYQYKKARKDIFQQVNLVKQTIKS